MLLRDTVHASVRGVLANKTQAFLTMLGIIIGVASVTLMQSLGASFEAYILDTISAVGSHTMGVVPKGINQMSADMTSLTYEDYVAIARLPTVTSITPFILVPQKATYKKESVSPFLIGARKEIFANYGMKLAEGRFLDANDELGAKSNVVIAHQTSKDLFGDEDPIGKRINIGTATFTVVGLLQEVGSPVLRELESAVIMPFSSAKVLTGQTALTAISLQTTDNAAVTKADITTVLRQRHQIHNPENDSKKDNFEIRSVQQASDIIGTVSISLTIFLSLIAGISLVVGGIGIMNIMLVSVMERTREIGLRKAVGARRRDILLQFLFEALTLTLIGGVAGLLVGAGTAWLITLIASRFLGAFPFILSLRAVLLALGMAVGTGLVFGIIPAKNAAELNPIEALRYE